MKSNKQKSDASDILRFLKEHPNQIYKSRELAKKMHIPNRDYQTFKRMVRQLAQSGEISRFKGNRYGHYRKPAVVTGILHVKTQGYGFLLRDDSGEEVFVSQRNMGTALHRDRVRVALWAQPVGRLPEGKVVEILQRGNRKIVGTFQESKTAHYVIPDDIKIGKDIYISAKDRSKTRSGQKVVVEVTQWDDYRKMPEGKIIKVLGDPDDQGVDVLSVIHQFDLPIAFSKAVTQEAGQIPRDIQSASLKNRLDLRNQLVFTIDPEDAKDFDDAISLEYLSNGNWLLGVHIADVSHYVVSGSAIDREALRRGTSVYLVDRTIPMLPERLSSDLCSLRPNEDRLTFSVLMELSEDGTLQDYQIKESVIHSRHRLTYRQVQKMIERDEGCDPRSNSLGEIKQPANKQTDSIQDDHILQETVIQMVQLSRKLMAKWKEDGSIDFEIPEPKVVLDDQGHVTDLQIRERLESHRLVEAFMLLANRTVAEHIHRLRQETHRKYPFAYRIHDKPKGKKLEEFILFIRALGYTFQVGKKITPKKFQVFLERIKGTKHEIIVEEVALRTMMKAVYSTQNVGHFGLAFKHYTHFTSPIRRYPDLIVHRLLKSYLDHEGHAIQMPMKLSEICEIATEREIIAQSAERESIKTKQVEFMGNHLGDVFEGVISGVTSFGIFIEIPEYLVEGLVHIKDLIDDYYLYDGKNYRLVGQNSGKIYRLGDGIQVRVNHISKEMRAIDFGLVEMEKESVQNREEKQSDRKRRKGKRIQKTRIAKKMKDYKTKD
ncbi:ribonuclease R [bacterium]|nr:ribonuclease R [bacterium]